MKLFLHKQVQKRCQFMIYTTGESSYNFQNIQPSRYITFSTLFKWRIGLNILKFLGRLSSGAYHEYFYQMFCLAASIPLGGWMSTDFTCNELFILIPGCLARFWLACTCFHSFIIQFTHFPLIYNLVFQN